MFLGNFAQIIAGSVHYPQVVTMRFKKLLLGSLNDINNFSSRVAYNLNLRGPAKALRQPALHHLWLFIWLVSHFLAGDCDMAVAGGVSITVPIKEGYLYEGRV